MNKIKKYIVDMLLAPIALLYQKVLDLEAIITKLKEVIAHRDETIKTLSDAYEHLDQQIAMMTEDLAEAGRFRSRAQELTLGEQVLKDLSGHATHDEVIELLRAGMHLARERDQAQKRAHQKLRDAHELALGRLEAAEQGRDFQQRRVQALEEAIAYGFGASAKHLVPDEHTLEAMKDVIEFVDETLVDGEAPPLSNFIDKDDIEAIRVHVSMLSDWFNRHTFATPTGPAMPPMRIDSVEGVGFTPPTRPAEPIVAQFTEPNISLPLENAPCVDGGACHHKCGDGPCFRREACAPLSVSQLEDDWTPQPQLSDRIIEQAMVHYGAGVPRGVFSAASYARAYREIVGTKRTLDGNEVRRHLARRADVEKMIGGSHFRYTGNALRLPGEPWAKVMSFAEIAKLPEKIARVEATVEVLNKAKSVEELMELIKEGVEAGVFVASSLPPEALVDLEGLTGQQLTFTPVEEPQDANLALPLAPIEADVGPTTIRPRDGHIERKPNGKHIATVNEGSLMVSEPTLYRNGEQLPSYTLNPSACHLALSNLDADDECPQCKLRACEHRNWIETERRRGRAQ